MIDFDSPNHDKKYSEFALKNGGGKSRFLTSTNNLNARDLDLNKINEFAARYWNNGQKNLAVDILAHTYGLLKKSARYGIKSQETIYFGINLARLYAELNRPEEAIKRSQEIFVENKDKAKIRCLVFCVESGIYASQSNHAMARAKAKDCIKDIQDFRLGDTNIEVEARMNLMNAYLRTGDLKKAKAEHRELIMFAGDKDINPRTGAKLIRSLAINSGKFGNLEEVQALRQQATNFQMQHPHNGPLKLSLGSLLDGELVLALGRDARAMYCFSEAAAKAGQKLKPVLGTAESDRQLSAVEKDKYESILAAANSQLLKIAIEIQNEGKDSFPELIEETLEELKPFLRDPAFLRREKPSLVLEMFQVVAKAQEITTTKEQALTFHIEARNYMLTQAPSVKAAGLELIEEEINILSSLDRNEQALRLAKGVLESVLSHCPTEREAEVHSYRIHYSISQIKSQMCLADDAIKDALAAAEASQRISIMDEESKTLDSEFSRYGQAFFKAMYSASEYASKYCDDLRSSLRDASPEARVMIAAEISKYQNQREGHLSNLYKRFAENKNSSAFKRLSSANSLAICKVENDKAQEAIDILAENINYLDQNLKLLEESDKDYSNLLLSKVNLVETISSAYMLLAKSYQDDRSMQEYCMDRIKRFEEMREDCNSKRNELLDISPENLFATVENLILKKKFTKASEKLELIWEEITDKFKSEKATREDAETLFKISEYYEKCEKVKDALDTCYLGFSLLKGELAISEQDQWQHRARLSDLSIKAKKYKQALNILEPIDTSAFEEEEDGQIEPYLRLKVEKLRALAACYSPGNYEYTKDIEKLKRFTGEDLSKDKSYEDRVKIIRARLRNEEQLGNIENAIAICKEGKKLASEYPINLEKSVIWYGHSARLKQMAGLAREAKAEAQLGIDILGEYNAHSTDAGIMLSSVIVLSEIDLLNHRVCHKRINDIFEGIRRRRAEIQSKSNNIMILAYQARARLRLESGYLVAAEEDYRFITSEVLDNEDLYYDRVECLEALMDSVISSVILEDKNQEEGRGEGLLLLIKNLQIPRNHPSRIRYSSWEVNRLARDIDHEDHENLPELVAHLDRLRSRFKKRFPDSRIPYMIKQDLGFAMLSQRARDAYLENLNLLIDEIRDKPNCKGLLTERLIERAVFYGENLKEYPECCQLALSDCYEAYRLLKAGFSRHISAIDLTNISIVLAKALSVFAKNLEATKKKNTMIRAERYRVRGLRARKRLQKMIKYNLDQYSNFG